MGSGGGSACLPISPITGLGEGQFRTLGGGSEGQAYKDLLGP